jgi:hypothetical protein
VLGLWRNVIRLENTNPIAYSGAQGWYDRELLAFLEAGRVGDTLEAGAASWLYGP